MTAKRSIHRDELERLASLPADQLADALLNNAGTLTSRIDDLLTDEEAVEATSETWHHKHSFSQSIASNDAKEINELQPNPMTVRGYSLSSSCRKAEDRNGLQASVPGFLTRTPVLKLMGKQAQSVAPFAELSAAISALGVYLYYLLSQREAEFTSVIASSEKAIQGSPRDDILYGTADDDVIFGLLGNDTLYGAQGNDTLVGGEGSNILHGGVGADTFIFKSAKNGSLNDTIADFEPGVDRIVLQGLDHNDISFIQVGADTFIVSGYEGGNVDQVDSYTDQIELIGVDVATLSISDFDFI
ncbi:M10 family metallopeptidase C-terminal domain-containing protein [uncultured Roseobacter sp.]|uniref:M10 family metallopeptidase C-terminal domain-containing protein n=1 Tax=uncultured Roseobacter sp. TaxID=114847 RepID=UPI0026272206|nr:M10 family metallopeptidase C-terminal domain-containing protein [uncultured Roseobacter sp.]